MTAMTPEQREAYAPAGGMLRKALDDGLAEWPTVEEADRESLLGDLLVRGETTLPDGTVVRVS